MPEHVQGFRVYIRLLTNAGRKYVERSACLFVPRPHEWACVRASRRLRGLLVVLLDAGEPGRE